MFKKYFLPILHLLIILAIISSPFWLNWKLIIIGYGLLQLQDIIFKACLLSISQFENSNEGFIYHYLHKMGFKLSMRQINFILNYILAPIIILTALIYQKVILWN